MAPQNLLRIFKVMTSWNLCIQQIQLCLHATLYATYWPNHCQSLLVQYVVSSTACLQKYKKSDFARQIEMKQYNQYQLRILRQNVQLHLSSKERITVGLISFLNSLLNSAFLSEFFSLWENPVPTAGHAVLETINTRDNCRVI